MSPRHSAKVVAVAGVWLVLLAAGVGAYRFIVAPFFKHREIEVTSTPPQAREGRLVRLALDSFSGYALFRSEDFRRELAAEALSLEPVDDGADYARRIELVRSGEVGLALFTVDALLKVCARIGDLPATVVQIVDETRGADAMVAYRDAVPNVDALNQRTAKIVLTPDSPSETLARVVQAHFDLPELDPGRSWVHADGAADVYRRLQRSDGTSPEAFVLWEPYVSRALADPRVHVLVDSSRFKGYIVDVLVAGRKFLIENESTVDSLVKAYLRASYAGGRDDASRVRLVLEDARGLGEPLEESQARRLVQSIWWKNTQENYAHLGILPPAERHGLQYLEDMIRNITGVLVKTGAIPRDPTGGQPNRLFYTKVFQRLHQSGFHPGLIASEPGETIRREAELPPLASAQWARLVPVGTLQVESLAFARGGSSLTERSRRVLERLVETLRDWPLYYLEVRGHARREGDLEANRRLARERAEAAGHFLIEKGIPPERLRAVATEPSGASGEAQSVTFVVGEIPY